jgi:2-polyprenyl-6-methoxyphenol hydroxylase-like FAD-dependent oxidoreductase
VQGAAPHNPAAHREIADVDDNALKAHACRIAPAGDHAPRRSSRQPLLKIHAAAGRRFPDAALHGHNAPPWRARIRRRGGPAIARKRIWEPIDMNHPVLIVGAGPVGLTMAMALKRRGVDVRIVDKAAAPSDKSKALVLWPRTLELLQIQGCASPFIAAGMRGRGARIFAEGNLLVQLRFDTARSAFDYALMIPQSETERILAGQLAELGAQVERRVELLSFSDNGDSVGAVLRHADGREENFDASYLCGCDGAHSTVRHGLDARFEGTTMQSDWALGDIHIDGDLPQDEIVVCWVPDGVLAIFPMGSRRFRVVADIGTTAASAPPTPTLEQIQELLDLRGPHGLRAYDPFWLGGFRINERKVKDYRRGRIFLSGDAAHVHSPAGGQGMNTGMQDAFNLAWKLAMVWHGHAGSSLLDSYSSERSAIGDQVLRNAGNMTRIALVRSPILRELRNLAAGTLSRIPALRQRMVDQLTELDLHYRENSPLTQTPRGAAQDPAPGERAPDIALESPDGGIRNLYGLLGTGRFVVLSVNAPAVDLPLGARAIAVAATAAANAAYESGHVFLIRPDAYVALSVRGGDDAAIIAALERLESGG